jgi:hypothetical protein
LENEIVKTLGARFAYRLQRWYVPEGMDLSPFRRWLTYKAEIVGPIDLVPFVEGERRKRDGYRRASLPLRQQWGAFFTAAGWRSAFHPQLDDRAPDFLLTLPVSEIRVDVHGWGKLEKLYAYTPEIDAMESWPPPAEVLIVGSYPLRVADSSGWHYVLGLFRHGEEGRWEPAIPICCPKCKGLSFCPESADSFCRVHGCGIKRLTKRMLEQTETASSLFHMAPTALGRAPLAVPFHQKDEAKSLGARWDRDSRLWYIPADSDPVPFRQWLLRPFDFGWPPL